MATGSIVKAYWRGIRPCDSLLFVEVTPSVAYHWFVPAGIRPNDPRVLEAANRKGGQMPLPFPRENWALAAISVCCGICRDHKSAGYGTRVC